MAKLFSGGSLSPMGHQVEKATSGLLMQPDWSSNMDIVDGLNTDPSQARDVMKVIKKRLQNKDARVQMLALTLLETMLKNCGEYVHVQVAEKDVLHEMVKIVKKKSNLQVRDQILELLDMWQEAFGGPTGRYPHYFQAYDELRRHGVSFPPRRHGSSIFNPPPMHPSEPHQPVPSYSSPGSPATAAPPPLEGVNDGSMGIGDIANARSSMEVLADMLSAVDIHDSKALKDDIIVDLVEQCHTNQRRIMTLVNTTGDEELLRLGLALNDDLQKVLVRHQTLEAGGQAPLEGSLASPPANLVRFDPDESVFEDEDDFGQLAHRSTARNRRQANLPVRPQGPPGPGPSPLSSSYTSEDLLSGGLGALVAPTPSQQQQQQQQFSNYSQERMPPPTSFNGGQMSYQSVLQQSQNSGSNPFYDAPPQQVSPPPPVQLSTQPQYPSQVKPATVQEQQDVSSSQAGHELSSASIRPIPGPPGQPISHRSVPTPQPSLPPVQIQQPPAVQQVDNPFDEGSYEAPTFQATALPPPPQQPSSDSPQSVYPGVQPPHFSNYGPTYGQPQLQPQVPLPVENNYVAPWAMAAQQPMSEQQRAYIYGSPQQLQGQPTMPWGQGPGLGQSPISPQQQAMLYGSPTAPQLGSLALPPPPAAASQRQEYVAQQKLLSPRSSEMQSSFKDGVGADLTGRVGAVTPNGSSTSQEKPALAKQQHQPANKSLTPQQLARNEDPMNTLFGDLVDLQSARAKKSALNASMASTRLEWKS